MVLSFNPAEIDLRLTDARSVTVPNFPYSLPFCYPHCRTLCFHCAYLSSKLFTRLDSSMFYCNKSWQRSFSHLSLHALLLFLTWLTCCSFFFLLFAPVLYCVRHMSPFKNPQPPKKGLSLFKNCQLKEVLSYQCFCGSLRENGRRIP